MTPNHPFAYRRPRRLRRRQEGVTLVEIMIVIIIMALIATGVSVMLFPRLGEARVSQTQTDIQAVRSAAQLFYMNQGECPSSVEDLTDGSNPYLDSSRRTEDAWGNEFAIECDGVDVIVSSAGPNGEYGDEDDVE